MSIQYPHDDAEDADQFNPGLTANGLPLPDPYPDYIVCPTCGEPEVEVWCYETAVVCHSCGIAILHRPPACFGSEHCKTTQKKQS